MAKANMDAWDGFIGRVGDTVTYIRMGKLVKRKIGISSKPATKDQRKSRQKIKITNEFISPVKEFIHVGMKPEGLAQKKTANDLMLSHTLLNAIKGEYPNQEIDYTKVQFTKGKMQKTTGLQVSLNEDGLEFSWDTDLVKNQFRHDDQLMVLVYLPKLKSAEFETHATRRSAGKYQFSMIRDEDPTLMEIYVSFMSTDQKRVTDSEYLGQMILPAYEE
ncbi:hypothetical protein SAMN06265348_109148 [Pedobacter westerhofensis]|uniref:Uncharacterized protein n=1 Tax=Pedobacter westerhofensis TaxID=425512 RepID=A0A521EUF6_9SPHI|nr:DUF6266 family protein [Pedobacter westerhofensis]SMO87552.1 hypothetical protein SAMN06265348_109148 [Pedobacter westerhofensis]